MSKLAALLKTVYLFRPFTDNVLARIATVTDELEFTPGSVILEADQDNDALWVLVEGEALIREGMGKGHKLDICILQDGDIFGDMSYYDGLPTSAAVIARSPLKVLRLPFAKLEEILAGYPELRLQMMRTMVQTMSGRLRCTNVAMKRQYVARMSALTAASSPKRESRSDSSRLGPVAGRGTKVGKTEGEAPLTRSNSAFETNVTEVPTDVDQDPATDFRVLSLSLHFGDEAEKRERKKI